MTFKYIYLCELRYYNNYMNITSSPGPLSISQLLSECEY